MGGSSVGVFDGLTFTFSYLKDDYNNPLPLPDDLTGFTYLAYSCADAIDEETILWAGGFFSPSSVGKAGLLNVKTR